VITPIKRVMEGPEALVNYAFEPLRCTPDGELDPDCPLNQDAEYGPDGGLARAATRESPVGLRAGRRLNPAGTRAMHRARKASPTS